MAGRLENKAVIVTGAAGGIGAGVADIVAAEGARVMIADIDIDGAEKQAETIRKKGGKASAAKVDLADEQTIKTLITRSAKEFGGIDGLVNAAADVQLSNTRDGPIQTMDFEIWDRLMQINVRGTAMMTKHIIPHLCARGGGSIVNISSGAAVAGGDGGTAYASGKAAVSTLTLYTATQHGKDWIRCNAILPGLIVTPATEDTFAAGKLGELISRHNLTPRHGRPSDIAWAVVWLISDESEFVTGQCLNIDGGQTAHQAAWADMRDLMAESGADLPSVNKG